MNPIRLSQLKAMMAEDPNDPFLPYAIAQEYMTAEQWQDACSEFAQLVVRFPEYLPTYYQYGIALVQLGQMDAAVDVLNSGLQFARIQKQTKTANELAALLEEVTE